MGIYDELARIDAEQDSQRGGPATRPTGRNANRTGAPITPPPVASPRKDATTDLVTLALGPIDLRAWRRGFENTETRNSALRLTSAERDRVEDLVRDLWRKHMVRTSMNEVARLGLRVIERDFTRSGSTSLVYRVKRS